MTGHGWLAVSAFRGEALKEEIGMTMADIPGVEAETEQKRLTLQAWAKGRGYERAIKALTGEDCDKLRDALQAHRKAVEAIESWEEKREAALSVVAAFEDALYRVKAAAAGGK
jgi:hypothetical protein